MSNAVSYLYEFGPFRLDPTERLLLRDGHPVPLTPKAFDVLMVLLQHSGHLVEKRELIEAVWPTSFVEEGNLSVMIHALRKAFGSDHRDHTYIETVSKRGYRFAAEVKLIEYAPFPPPSFIDKGQIEPAASPRLAVALPTISPRLSSSSASSSDWERPLPWHVKRGRRLLWVLVALVPVVATGAFLWMKILPRNKPVAVASQAALARSLAVLPFTTIGENTDDLYLGLGISDAVTTKLGNTRKIVIRPTSTMARYVGAARDPEAAGREQKVDAVLDGRIQRAGDRIRLTVQLIRVSDGAQ